MIINVDFKVKRDQYNELKDDPKFIDHNLQRAAICISTFLKTKLKLMPEKPKRGDDEIKITGQVIMITDPEKIAKLQEVVRALDMAVLGQSPVKYEGEKLSYILHEILFKP